MKNLYVVILTLITITVILLWVGDIRPEQVTNWLWNRYHEFF